MEVYNEQTLSEKAEEVVQIIVQEHPELDVEGTTKEVFHMFMTRGELVRYIGITTPLQEAFRNSSQNTWLDWMMIISNLDVTMESNGSIRNALIEMDLNPKAFTSMLHAKRRYNEKVYRIHEIFDRNFTIQVAIENLYLNQQSSMFRVNIGDFSEGKLDYIFHWSKYVMGTIRQKVLELKS